VKRNFSIVVTAFVVTIRWRQSCARFIKRPLICQVEKQYQLNYQQQYSWQEFITLNREACLILEKLEQ
jgi:hypothetical protein